MKRIQLGPFNRVEGDLEVGLDVDAGCVAAARVNSPLFRGFEQVLVGRPPEDALAIVPRICGICSVAQSAAAASALAALAGVTPPPNGQLASRLVLATENCSRRTSPITILCRPHRHPQLSRVLGTKLLCGCSRRTFPALEPTL